MYINFYTVRRINKLDKTSLIYVSYIRHFIGFCHFISISFPLFLLIFPMCHPQVDCSGVPQDLLM